MRAAGTAKSALLALLLTLAPARGDAKEPVAPPLNLAQIDRCTTSHDATSRLWACSLLLNSTPPAPADAAQYHVSRGYAFLALDWEEAALRDFDRALALDPQFRDVYQVRTQIFRERRDYTRAAEELSRLIEFSPRDPVLYVERGSTLAFAGAFDAALRDFSTAISIAESYEPIADFYLARAGAFEMAGHYDAALRDIDTALARNGDQATGLEAKGRLLFLMERWNEAKAVLTQAVAAPGAGPYAQIWLYLSDLRSGSKAPVIPERGTEAAWPASVLDAVAGRVRVSEILPVTWSLDRDAAFDSKTKLCELSYFMGERMLGTGHADDARRYFEQARNTALSELAVFHAAQHRLAAFAGTKAALK